MPSIRDVAREAGVSIATVSRVMNGTGSVASELRSKVMDAVDRCDYAPKVGRRSLGSVALIYIGPFTIGSPYDSACLDGMVEAMRESDVDLAIIDLQRDRSPGETLRQFFARKGLRGAVIRCTAEERGLAVELANEGLPLVMLGDHFECDKLSFVFAESKTASHDAMEHLVSLGHTRIAFAACDRDDGDHLDRLLAYRSVLEENNLIDESLICRVPPSRFDGAQLLHNLLGMPNRPTAIFVADPLVAVGVVIEAHRLGVRIPEDLSVVGFDDTDTRNSVFPRLSAVCQDSKALGKLAWELVSTLAASDSAPKPRSSIQKAWLDIGNSTGPPPARPDRVLPTGARVPMRVS